MLNRRELLGTAAAAGAAACLAGTVRAQDGTQPQFRVIDTNVSLFQWPFRRLPLDETDALVNKLRSLGIGKAWAGSFEGLLHREIAGVNLRLAAACETYPELTPIGSVNPELPGWEEDLRRCVEEHRMPGIRLHPNYHGYTLDSPRFGQLLKRAADAGLLVQIAASMEDTRTQHQLLQTPDVDLTPLVRWLRELPQAKVQVLNYRPRPPLLEQLAAVKNIYFDTARVEGTDAIPQLAERVSPERVLFGSHAPFFVPEAALIRVYESGRLGEAELRQVLAGNAEQLSAKARAKT